MKSLTLGGVQEILDIEAAREHRQRSVRIARPLALGLVPIELDAVLVGIAQIKRLAHAMIRRAVKRNTVLGQSLQRIGEIGAGRIEDGEVKQAGGAGRRR